MNSLLNGLPDAVDHTLNSIQAYPQHVYGLDHAGDLAFKRKKVDSLITELFLRGVMEKNDTELMHYSSHCLEQIERIAKKVQRNSLKTEIQARILKLRQLQVPPPQETNTKQKMGTLEAIQNVFSEFLQACLKTLGIM